MCGTLKASGTWGGYWWGEADLEEWVWKMATEWVEVVKIIGQYATR